MNLKSSPAKWVVSLPRPEVVNLIGLRSRSGWGDQNGNCKLQIANCETAASRK
jgi:hypothetical protein